MKQDYFSADYTTARQRFRAAVAAAGGDLHCLPLDVADLNGQPLGIDIAWFGHRQPNRALVHFCGIHGVEGFAGSAVQLALLDDLPNLPDDGALILVHIFNPYGMAHLRRGNGSNVDLNRNFFFGTTGWSGIPDGYAALNSFLNPPRPPSRINFFQLRLFLAEISLGTGAIRQAVAGGQYHFPMGIFYGGNVLEIEPRRYSEWLASNLGGARELLVIDVHTGLGNYGQQALFLRSPTIDAEELADALGLPLATRAMAADVMGYEHEGGHSSVYRQILPAARQVCLTQEFGTYDGRRLLRALRAENQHHHYGDGSLDHWSKCKLKQMFCPDDHRWRRQVVTQGCDLVRRAVPVLFSGSNR
jgi:hypothetical protein